MINWVTLSPFIKDDSWPVSLAWLHAQVIYTESERIGGWSFPIVVPNDVEPEEVRAILGWVRDYLISTHPGWHKEISETLNSHIEKLRETVRHVE
jgi:hypothetical protein